MDAIECANCSDKIGRLETPRVFNDQPVCQRCWDKLIAQKALAEIQSEAVGYESRLDTATRMRGAAPTPVKRIGASPILIIGRIIFGFFTLVGIVVAIRGKFGAVEDERAIYAGINIIWPCALIFFATFVKRAF